MEIEKKRDIETKIKWHKTSEVLPERKLVFEGEKNKIYIEKQLLVIWEGKVKPSRYIESDKRWEGHNKDQIPEYWIALDEITVSEVE